ncbi:hypothetical protein HY251_06150, partial [bacterium]|nr:hypothetical protein [bacterium]
MSPDTPETPEPQAPATPPEAAPPAATPPAAEAAPPAPPAEGGEPATAEAPKEPPKPEVEFPEDAKKGRVAVWNAGNKQGEIRPDDGTINVRFHVKQVVNPAPEPKEGDKVAYKAPEATKTAKGKELNPQATEIWVIERAPSRPKTQQLEFAGKVRGRPEWTSPGGPGDRGGRGRGGPG